MIPVSRDGPNYCILKSVSSVSAVNVANAGGISPSHVQLDKLSD